MNCLTALPTRYLLTCPGYAGRSGTIDPAHSASGALVLKIDEDTVAVTDGAARAGMTLRAAQKNETIQSLPAEWADFRGTSYDASGTRGGSAGSNNAVVSIQTPIDADASTLYWSNALGSGTGSRSTGCPLLVDGVLIVYAGDTLYRDRPGFRRNSDAGQDGSRIELFHHTPGICQGYGVCRAFRRYDSGVRCRNAAIALDLP